MNLFATIERPVMALVRILGLALLSGAVTTSVGFCYRWYARQRMPTGLAVLVGCGSIGIWLNTSTALSQYVGGGNAVPPVGTALVNVAAFALGAATAVAGARTGEAATGQFGRSAATELEGDVSRFVQAVGRFVTVELPEEIEDIEGYEPVAPETKAALSGATYRFPRRMTVTELRERLVARLRDDYAIGHVDVDLADDGTVSYVAVGGRAAGIGPTLPPGTVAVAVRADPAFSASAGDLVQVWEPSETGDAERVATAELRATVGDVATLALDADATLDPETEYRLVTLPTEPRADREFSAQLRAADETVSALELDEDSPLVGLPVGGLVVAVVAVRGDAGVETLPPRERLLRGGDTLFVVAQPELLRKVETAAGSASGAAPSVVLTDGG
ncbi:potassium transporter TrkA [Halorussus halophilus]|uniref:potassium transporter TrkA n=1 Tax=Halorussus halophilus TaxID=2650975 RepID=UPI00130144CC|nr:potassium transporter TrkA [Halorussus halophilus]